MNTNLLNIIALRDTLTHWFPTALSVQLSYGRTYFRIQVLRADGCLTGEYRISWDDLLQADNVEERLKEFLTKAGSAGKHN